MSGISRSGTKWGKVGRVAADQHGVVSRAQLRNLGIGDGAIEKAVASGRLYPSLRGTFGVGRRPHTHRARMQAAVLACGPGAVVSHLSAAHLLGLRDRHPTSWIEVIAPGGAGRLIEGVRRRHVHPPTGAEVGQCDAIPCTSPSRTLVDLAAVLGAGPLRGVVERSAVQGSLDVEATERILAARRRCGAPLLRRILRDWQTIDSASPNARNDPDLRSELEARLMALIAAAGLPAPACNRPIDVEGKRFVADFLWSERRLIVETDGKRVHGHALAFERDRLRDRLLQLDGYRVIRVTYRQVRREPDAVIAAIRSLLENPIR